MKAKKNGNRAFPIEGIDAALCRAALKARELAERTQTPFLILREGRIVDLREDAAKRQPSRTTN